MTASIACFFPSPVGEIVGLGDPEFVTRNISSVLSRFSTSSCHMQPAAVEEDGARRPLALNKNPIMPRRHRQGNTCFRNRFMSMPITTFVRDLSDIGAARAGQNPKGFRTLGTTGAVHSPIRATCIDLFRHNDLLRKYSLSEQLYDLFKRRAHCRRSLPDSLQQDGRHHHAVSKSC